MILKALTLENFKGIREPVRIEFAPLTLLFGPNNAGKSTIDSFCPFAF
jgi:AAA15 family ATPase/GTPase